MALKINLNKAKRVIFEPDYYKFRIDIAEERRKDKQGNKLKAPGLHLELVCEDDDFPEYKGARVFRELSFADNAQWAVAELLAAVQGFDDPNSLQTDDEAGDLEFDVTELLNANVTCFIDTDTFNGREQNRVISFHIPGFTGEDEGEPLEDEVEEEAAD